MTKTQAQYNFQQSNSMIRPI